MTSFLFFRANCIICIWIEIADNCSSNKRLNSSKQPHAPDFTKPINILPIALKSIPSSQLKTKTCLPKA